ncbi:MAG: amino acid permease [Pseudomonadales bacterium]
MSRTLGRLELILLGIGAIIGAGVFVLTGVVAATKAGPGVALSFVISGLACTLTALAYAELAAAIGGCGGAYGYAYAGLGEIVAWAIGWALTLEYGLAVAAVAVGWSGYVNNALASIGMEIPSALLYSPAEGGVANVPAAAIIVTLGILLIIGVRSTATFNAMIVAVKLIAIVTFLVVAAGDFELANWNPYLPFGVSGVLGGAALVFFAYIGFDAVATAAEEARDPQRDIPAGILASLGLCTLLYVAVAAVLTGAAPYTTLDNPSPVAAVLLDLGHRFAAGLVAAGALAGLTSVMLVCYYAQTRVIYAMARDGLLPPVFTQLHASRGTPVVSIVLSGICITLVAAMVPLTRIAELVNMGTLAAFTVVCLGVVSLRITHPELPRPFRAPLSPWLPLAGAAFCLLLMVYLPLFTWIGFASWMVLGLLLYSAYGYRHALIGIRPEAGQPAT